MNIFNDTNMTPDDDQDSNLISELLVDFNKTNFFHDRDFDTRMLSPPPASPPIFHPPLALTYHAPPATPKRRKVAAISSSPRRPTGLHTSPGAHRRFSPIKSKQQNLGSSKSRIYSPSSHRTPSGGTVQRLAGTIVASTFTPPTFSPDRLSSRGLLSSPGSGRAGAKQKKKGSSAAGTSAKVASLGVFGTVVGTLKRLKDVDLVPGSGSKLRLTRGKGKNGEHQKMPVDESVDEMLVSPTEPQGLPRGGFAQAQEESLEALARRWHRAMNGGSDISSGPYGYEETTATTRNASQVFDQHSYDVFGGSNPDLSRKSRDTRPGAHHSAHRSPSRHSLDEGRYRPYDKDAHRSPPASPVSISRSVRKARSRGKAARILGPEAYHHT